MSRRKKDNKIVKLIIDIVIIGLCILGLSALFNDDKTKTTSSNNVVSNKVNNVSNRTNNTVSNNNSVNNKINNNTLNTQNGLENQIDEEARLKEEEEEKKKQEELEKQNQIKTKDNKAISLAKKAWGEDSTVNFVIDEKNENGIYKISVVEKATTKVILWYEVNIITETVEETF